MNRNNNGNFFVELETPEGERFVSNCEISSEEFYKFLKPIHINKHPFIDDNIEEIEKTYQQRENFIKFLSENISDTFMKYFDSIDTVNGYTKEKL